MGFLLNCARVGNNDSFGGLGMKRWRTMMGRGVDVFGAADSRVL